MPMPMPPPPLLLLLLLLLIFWWWPISDDRYRSIRFVSSSKQFLQTSTVSKQTNKQTIPSLSFSTLCVRWYPFVIASTSYPSLSLFYVLSVIFSLFYYILDDDDDVPFRTDHIKEYFLSFLLFLWKSTFGRSIGCGARLAAASYYVRVSVSSWLSLSTMGIFFM